MNNAKRFWAALLAMALLAMGLAAHAEQAAEATPTWTVLIYMCGSDLESEGGLATANLSEISRCSPFPGISPISVKMENVVNILIETGGCRQWRTEGKLGFSIAPDRLSRFRYEPELEQPFVLVEEQPLERMSDPQTLSEFIRWGVETCPAQRYALVLWGHGGGSHTGLLPDECFDNRYMDLKELNQALDDGGAQFEIMVMDACMMANLETAQAVKDYTGWLAASEEVVAGSGSAYDVWLNELYACPESDGYRVGRNICDSVQKKYADLGDEQAKSILTFSLIDTSKVDAVAARFEDLWRWMREIYDKDPAWFGFLCTVLGRTESYGTAADHMMDIGAMMTQFYSASLIEGHVRSPLTEALIEAVPYMVKGSGRSEARGLSFCYGPAMSAEELDIYAKNCVNPAYLAWLDAVNPEWTAPDWVYGQAERLTPIEALDAYALKLSVEDEGGLPKLVAEDVLETVSSCSYLLYRYEENSGELLKLGESVCEVKANHHGGATATMNLARAWPAINGQICDLELVARTGNYYLYNIPMLILDTRYDLRVAFALDAAKTNTRRDWYVHPRKLSDTKLYSIDDTGDYEVYGFWKGYDDNSLNASRDTTSPALLEGQEYRLMYPIQLDGHGGDTYYELGDTQTMPGKIEIKEVPLPVGRYAAAFLITDIFGREVQTERVDLMWDGTNWSRAE